MDSRLRIGGWVPTHGAEGQTRSRGPAADDAVTQHLDYPVAALGDQDSEWPGGEPDSYRGERRTRHGMVVALRVGAAAGGVAVLLVGASVLAQSLTSEPVPLPAPPPSPEHSQPAPTTPGGTAQLGVGPTPTSTPTPTHSPTPAATTPPPDPSPTPDPTSTTPPTRSYEAEEAELDGGAEVRAQEGASGGEVVRLGWRGNAAFTATVDTAGEYVLRLHYAASRGGEVEVTVNDGGERRVHLERQRDETIAEVSMPVELTAGENRIRIASTGLLASWPRLDRIVVTE